MSESNEHDVGKRQDPDQTANHHGCGGDSAHLLEAAALLCGSRGAFRFGRSQFVDYPEERERQIAGLAGLPQYELTDTVRIATGGEHVVYRTSDATRIVKVTQSGFFGRTMDEDQLFDPRTFLNVWRLRLRNGLPAEYLARWFLLEMKFGLATRLEGVLRSEGSEPQLVISQEFLGPDMPEIEEVEAHMIGLGFEKVEKRHVINPENQDVTWYRQLDGMLVTDAFPRNFRIDKPSGAIVPIDLMVNVVPPGASKILSPAVHPFSLPSGTAL
jgi:hypothetical protein